MENSEKNGQASQQKSQINSTKHSKDNKLATRGTGGFKGKSGSIFKKGAENYVELIGAQHKENSSASNFTFTPTRLLIWDHYWEAKEHVENNITKCAKASKLAFYTPHQQVLDGEDFVDATDQGEDIVVSNEMEMELVAVAETAGLASTAFYRFFGWRKEDMKVQLVDKSFQYMHLKVSYKDGKDWLFTPIYASPYEGNRKILWDALKSISNNMHTAWLLAGDFNDIASNAEKKGGVAASPRRCNTFLERNNSCKLID
ncbi:hypothetical protein P8452_08420 [Trifolium repens]|nr:hypothetical protein P8452_08420 [Trifolium repens]